MKFFNAPLHKLALITAVTANLLLMTVNGNNSTTNLYSKDFDYLRNGVLKGVANDEIVFEISPLSLAQANLTTLVDWMQWLEDLQTHVQKLGETIVTEESELDFICIVHMDKLEGSDHREKRIDTMVRTLKYYQLKMEEELRKPEKSWNYQPNVANNE